MEFPQSYVLAGDISVRALAVAAQNDLRHEGRVDFVQSNLLSDIEFDVGGERFDVIIANLPYVSRSWDWIDEKNLGFEPRSAIFARGSNGLALYQRFLVSWKNGRNWVSCGRIMLWLRRIRANIMLCQRLEKSMVSY